MSRKESDYAKRNVSDLIILLTSVQDETITDPNEIWKLLEELIKQFGLPLAKCRADGQSTDSLEQSVKELSEFVAMVNQENSDNENQKQTMGVAVRQVPIGADNTSLGLSLKQNR